MDVLDPIGERLNVLNVFFIFRVYQCKEKRIDVLFDIFDFVNPFTDDVVQLDQSIRVVRLDVHQGINAVVCFGIL